MSSLSRSPRLSSTHSVRRPRRRRRRPRRRRAPRRRRRPRPRRRREPTPAPTPAPTAATARADGGARNPRRAPRRRPRRRVRSPRSRAPRASTGNTPQTPDAGGGGLPRAIYQASASASASPMRAGSEASRRRALDDQIFRVGVQRPVAEGAALATGTLADGFDGARVAVPQARTDVQAVRPDAVQRATATSIGKQNAPRVLLKCDLRRAPRPRVPVRRPSATTSRAGRIVRAPDRGTDFDLASMPPTIPSRPTVTAKPTATLHVAADRATRADGASRRPRRCQGRTVAPGDPTERRRDGQPERAHHRLRARGRPSMTPSTTRYGDRMSGIACAAARRPRRAVGDDAVEACMKQWARGVPQRKWDVSERLGDRAARGAPATASTATACEVKPRRATPRSARRRRSRFTTTATWWSRWGGAG